MLNTLCRKAAASPIAGKSGHSVLAFVLAVLLLLCFSSTAHAVTGADIIDTANKYLGYPYGHQRSGPDAFDCGGFVWFVYDQAGLTFPLRENSDVLAAANTAIYDQALLEVGDILFFGSSPQAIGHWGIYAGGGMVIHSYNSSTGVVYTPIDQVRPSFCYGCRLNGLQGCNTDYALCSPHISLPSGIDSSLIPVSARGAADENISAVQMAYLISHVCEAAAMCSSGDIFGGADQNEPALLWSDNALALASRTMSLARFLQEGPSVSRHRAAALITASLYRDTGMEELLSALPVKQISPDHPYFTPSPDPGQMLEPYMSCDAPYTYAQAYDTAMELYRILTGFEKGLFE